MYAAAPSGVIGVLDLQGGVQEHLEHLRRIEVAGQPIKHASDLEGLAGLIIPGGESTCLARLLRIFGLREAIEAHYHQGLKLWGTCAGAILLARENIGEAPCLGLIDIAVSRNAFGSQLDSFNDEALAPALAREPIPLTFIRAPKIISVGTDVRVLLQLNDYIAAAEDDRILVTIFHPELTPSLAFHRYFARKCGLNPASGDETDLDPNWTPQSWIQSRK
ncbi:MAG: pyridoxal 5'-phosphate synthase glutaminase subunit PdxT [Gammaproteobacteria bacterium]|nr:pyridoxal 5'-phosphate synthase glutaminase subunit PdxT [Gammaproteobacteria bacterium]MCP5196568.1 pyridoxal 5'-phosphate synthase glutaminase subunit PdxT [Gammaproteobacteria bacterium]